MANNNDNENRFIQRTTNRDKLNQRIKQAERLLEELKGEKERIESNSPPERGSPMENHVIDLAERTDIGQDEIIHRTRKKNGGKQKVPSGFNKNGVIKINQRVFQLEKENERLREKLGDEAP